MAHAITEAALRARSGDTAAARAFVSATQTDVWRLCAHLSARSSADDLTQNVYLRAWTALPGWRGEASARTWLLAIARRACAQAVRRRWRGSAAGAASGDPEVVPDPAETVALDQLIARLDPQRRSAFVLTQLLGLSYAEAAKVCGCPVGTIRSRVARARGDLLEGLRDRGPAPQTR